MSHVIRDVTVNTFRAGYTAAVTAQITA